LIKLRVIFLYAVGFQRQNLDTQTATKFLPKWNPKWLENFLTSTWPSCIAIFRVFMFHFLALGMVQISGHTGPNDRWFFFFLGQLCSEKPDSPLLYPARFETENLLVTWKNLLLHAQAGYQLCRICSSMRQIICVSNCAAYAHFYGHKMGMAKWYQFFGLCPKWKSRIKFSTCLTA
jgi:hypothetical protein